MCPPKQLKIELSFTKKYPKIKTDSIKMRLWCNVPAIKDISRRIFFLMSITFSGTTECVL